MTIVDIVFVIFVGIAFVTFVDILSVALIISLRADTKVSAILLH